VEAGPVERLQRTAAMAVGVLVRDADRDDERLLGRDLRQRAVQVRRSRAAVTLGAHARLRLQRQLSSVLSRPRT
jgi:hypothetical protein